jgi:pyruvate formate lyase activating enzyme
MIAETALKYQCDSVAYTYNDPVIFHEYAIDTAQACRSLGIKSVAVSAGYVCDLPRAEFYQWMDAANIDLKAFSERFYQQITGSHLQSILETLCYIKHETSTWLELTTLLIPGENDSEAELEAMTQWVVENLGHDVPMHFTAFHPDWKMRDKPPTPTPTLLKARDIALKNGVHYAYIGNVHNKPAESTYCHGCGQLLIGRDWYELSDWNIDDSGCCRFCGERCAGIFKPKLGN